ncbi:hypothetical protein [Halotia branconii]|uniref:hypothetical protein n=1 Tax=Halotia branconii TaxID=1620816 RepID=UPI0031B83EE8
MGFVTGLLPGKKKGKSNGYYLELDEAKEVAKDTAKEVASNAQKFADTVAANAQKAADTVTSTAKKAVETVTSDAPESSAPASLNGTKTAATKAKSKTKTKAKTAKKEAKSADVEMVQTAEGLKVQPGKKEKAAAAKVVKEQPKETTFAPKYLAPSATNSNGRRRPGANMSAYLDMARQVKTPS